MNWMWQSFQPINKNENCERKVDNFESFSLLDLWIDCGLWNNNVTQNAKLTEQLNIPMYFVSKLVPLAKANLELGLLDFSIAGRKKKMASDR